jgi:hypothetical protein
MNQIRSFITALIIILAVLGFSFIAILLRDNFEIFQVKLIAITILLFIGHASYNVAKKL